VFFLSEKMLSSVLNWAVLWRENRPAFSGLFGNVNSFVAWCSVRFAPRVPSEVSVEEIVRERKKYLVRK